MHFMQIRHFKRYTVFPSLSFCHCLDTETTLEAMLESQFDMIYVQGREKN